MGIKLVFLLLLGISATVSAYSKTECGSGREHNLVQGRREPGDRLLYTTRVKRPRAFLIIQKHHFKWPNHSWDNIRHITRFEVLDQFHDGSGGCAFITGGGLGMKYLLLQMKTQRSGELEFVVRIYGR